MRHLALKLEFKPRSRAGGWPPQDNAARGMGHPNPMLQTVYSIISFPLYYISLGGEKESC